MYFSRLEVLPGYSVSVTHRDDGLFLCAEVVHKVLHSESVLQTMYDMYSKEGRSQEVFYDLVKKLVVGSEVFTR